MLRSDLLFLKELDYSAGMTKKKAFRLTLYISNAQHSLWNETPHSSSTAPLIKRSLLAFREPMNIIWNQPRHKNHSMQTMPQIKILILVKGNKPKKTCFEIQSKHPT